jgi:hypothetical protein
MKEAFLVFGPESSGTRLMTRVLIACGCVGDGGHKQGWDSIWPRDEDLIVWRRSFPHERRWPNIAQIVEQLRSRGYQVSAFLTNRDWYATARSQVYRGHVPSLDVAYWNISSAFARIASAFQTMEVPYQIAQYEILPDVRYLTRLLQRFSLQICSQLEPIENFNHRYYEDESLRPGEGKEPIDTPASEAPPTAQIGT